MISLATLLVVMISSGCSASSESAHKPDKRTASTASTGSSSGEPHASNASASAGTKPAAPNGWTLENGKLVPAPVTSPFVPVPSPGPSTPLVPAAATGDPAKDWALEYERTENGPEADLVVRTGDINNLGFGWPQGFDPFSGQSTPPHPWPNPNKIPAGAPDGTDRIMIGSALDPPADYPTHYLVLDDGYSGNLQRCEGLKPPPGQVCKERAATTPQAIRLAVGALPAKIDEVLFQMFVDDFQAKVIGSHFQVSLNGTRIPSFEYAINSLDQTGPIGKLVSVRLLPEYWPLLKSAEVNLLIDDPTTKLGDGYAVDFVRILFNPHNFKYQVALAASVVDADTHKPISGATVTAALQSASTDHDGKCQLSGIPAGLVIATAAAPGYDENSVSLDLVSGKSGDAEIQLHHHDEGTAALERAVQQTGSATVYGIHFDTDSAKLRPDSLPALNAVLGLINNHPDSRWTIAGHTDNQGGADHNQTLSENRAASVIAWLQQHGADSSRLLPQGFGASRPVADNTSPNGRALNRRVEVALAK
jgi:outer membrane protein OmpA-like peptidoglycan-associated protein